MSSIIVRWGDNNAKTFGKKLDELQAKFPLVLPREINKVGNRAKTQVIRNLTKQTGLKRGTIVRAIGKPKQATAGSLSYEMETGGGNIRLKFLAPKETRPGATAKPWNKRQLFPGTFMHGGRFPNRHGGNFGGHVMRRLNSSGTKLTQARSGMFIPVEMVKGATAAAFNRTAGPLLQQRVEAAIRKLVP